MKLMIAAITMLVATPVLAQTAAPADVHTPHANQAGKASHDRHERHDMARGCCAKDADGKMACCDKVKTEGKAMSPSEASAADPHTGHGTNQH